MPKKGKGKGRSKGSSAAAQAHAQDAGKARKDDGQTLPSKEAALFKQLAKYTETKQHKKALKTADAILKNYPIHGETLAMKALVQNGLKKHEEAETLVKQGIRYNIKSYVCWHVYGLIHRSHQRYQDAIKCYQMAVKFDPENQSILRDLASLLIQMRNLEEFQEVRRKILMLKSSNKGNWLAYAVGSHLSGNHTLCLEILQSYIGTQTEDQKQISYENSELLLYHNQVLVESERWQDALTHLESISSKVKDQKSLHETKGALLVKLARLEEAAVVYRELLDRNPENLQYHALLRKALSLDPPLPQCRPALAPDAPLSCSKWRSRDLGHSYLPLEAYSQEQIQGLKNLYQELNAKYPKCAAVRRLPLDFLSGDEFLDRVGAYIQPMLRRGIPSLFRDLKPLFRDHVKRDAVEKLVTQYAQELRSHGRFTAEQEEGAEPPSALLWTLYYLGHHHDFRQQPQKALACIEEAITHTPTTIDLFVLKARVFKHAGDHQQAFEAMNHARSLDLADRYLNTKCVRYAWRNHMESKAQEIVKLFLRPEDGLNALYDMQVMWYSLAAARSYSTQQPPNHAMALKHWDNIRRHYNQIREDQFDFHSYCLRKVTLRAYVDMLRFADRLHSHRYYLKAAWLAVELYLEMHSAPRGGGTEEEEDYTGLSEAEIKRKQKAAKRRQNKAAAAAAAAAQESAADADNHGKPVKRGRGDEIDEDPLGKKLAETKDPLADATVIIKELQKSALNEVRTHILAFEVYMHKRRPLLALQALKRGTTLDREHPDVHFQAVRFFHELDSGSSQVAGEVKQVVQVERKEMCGGELSDLNAYNESYLKNHARSLPHCISVARSLRLLHEGSASHAQQAVKLVSTFDRDTEGVTPQVCQSAWKLLQQWEPSAAEALRVRCRELFPLCAVFLNAKERQQREAEAKQRAQDQALQDAEAEAKQAS